MPTPTVRSTSRGGNDGTEACFVTLPAGIQDGDIVQISFATGLGSVGPHSSMPTGFVKLVDQTVNSRRSTIYVKKYVAAESLSTYRFLINAASYMNWVAVAIKDTNMDSITTGPFLKRAASGTVSTAPSMSAPANSLVLATTIEATNAAENNYTSVSGGTPIVSWIPLANGGTGGIENQVIAEIAKTTTATTTSAFSVTWPNAAANGSGVQLAYGYVGAVLDRGLIRTKASLNPTSTSVTIGVESVAPGSVQAQIELTYNHTMQTFTSDLELENGVWKSVTFEGLVPGENHSVRIFVDGVLQVDGYFQARTLYNTPINFSVVTGSCQSTGSNHNIWDRIVEKGPNLFVHMGDFHYVNATDYASWYSGMISSLSAPKFRRMLEYMPMTWTPDNHDRIIVNTVGDPTLGLNLGSTDPTTQIAWKTFSGPTNYPLANSLARTWTIGRVRFIQTDGWSARDDPDSGANPLSFLGAEQKQWWKDTLTNATEPLIVWFTQQTAKNNGLGRWGSYHAETTELESWLNARPNIKRRMVMVGGDSHSLQADTGTRPQGTYRFSGIPSLNISGFNKGSETGDSGTAWDIANGPTRPTGSLESDWGSYSLLTVIDNGLHLRFRWEGISVSPSGTEKTIAYFERSYSTPFTSAALGDNMVDEVRLGNDIIWEKDAKGNQPL